MRRRRRALATAILAAAPFSAFFGSAAQEQPQTADSNPPIDFVIRPSQDIGDGTDDDIWNWDNGEPGPSMIDAPIGPPLAGPSAEDLIGPPLAGPEPEPRPVRERKVRRSATEDPFAQRGVSVGSFVIRPSIEVGVSATDNAGGSANKVAAVGAVVAPEINVTSEGERYSFEADARATAITYEKSEYNERTVEALAKLRYDLTTRTSIFTEAAYSHFLEGFSDPDTPSGASKRPAVDDIAGSLGVEERFGRLATRFTAFVDRATHNDVTLADGGVASRAELDNTEFGARVRAGYASSASLRPFVEAAVGRRAFDQTRDDSGYAHSSVWGELRGGLVIDRGEKLSGEASLGFRHEDLADSRLEDLNIAVANAAIIWSPRRLTEVKLDLSTDVNSTTIPGASATVLYAGTLTLTQNLSARVRGEAGVGLSYEDRIGDNWRDVTFTGFTGVSYAFSRTASIEGRYVYERTDRNEPDGKYDSHEVSVRLRLQR